MPTITVQYAYYAIFKADISCFIDTFYSNYILFDIFEFKYYNHHLVS